MYLVKAFFLDRDGVINIDHGYLSKPEQFDFNPGVFDACKLIKDAGYAIIIVTNQSGIARGYFSEQAFLQLNNWMIEQFAQKGINIDKVYYCPHHAKKGQGHYLLDCDCRKPKPGMLLKAKEAFDIDMANSVIVGDKVSDMEAGKSAGVRTGYLISSDYHEVQQLEGVTVTDSLLSAVRHVIGK